LRCAVDSFWSHCPIAASSKWMNMPSPNCSIAGRHHGNRSTLRRSGPRRTILPTKHRSVPLLCAPASSYRLPSTVLMMRRRVLRVRQDPATCVRAHRCIRSGQAGRSLETPLPAITSTTPIAMASSQRRPLYCRDGPIDDARLPWESFGNP
jgi:hypothetical protein